MNKTEHKRILTDYKKSFETEFDRYVSKKKGHEELLSKEFIEQLKHLNEFILQDDRELEDVTQDVFNGRFKLAEKLLNKVRVLMCPDESELDIMALMIAEDQKT